MLRVWRFLQTMHATFREGWDKTIQEVVCQDWAQGACDSSPVHFAQASFTPTSPNKPQGQPGIFLWESHQRVGRVL